MSHRVERVTKAVLRRVFSAIPRRSCRRFMLLICDEGLTADYLAEIWHLLKADHRLRFRLLMPRREDHPGAFGHIRETLPLKRVRSPWATLFRWDLMILADHGRREMADAHRSPVVRLQHGIPGKRIDNEVYAFGRGAYAVGGGIRYTRVFVSGTAIKDLAVTQDPVFEGVVTVVGSLADDRMLAEQCRREEYRRQMGFRPEDVVVFVTSTFGPNSLFHRMGDAFLAEARRLQGEFRFILSAHPREYIPKGPGERVWGEYLHSQTQHGFLVREPSESWIPYMIACDIVLTDHTAVATHGAILGRPLVYVPIPDGAIDPGSVIGQLREISPVMREDASDLRDVLLRARSHYPHDKMRGLVSQLNACPGEAATRMRDEIYAILGLACPIGSKPSLPLFPDGVTSPIEESRRSDQDDPVRIQRRHCEREQTRAYGSQVSR